MFVWVVHCDLPETSGRMWCEVGECAKVEIAPRSEEGEDVKMKIAPRSEEYEEGSEEGSEGSEGGRHLWRLALEMRKGC